ncbi:hypothetical protein [Pollutimonas sp. M17]|uniref:hypothetical protein n=1 Tax=Pollutimonas sp. M17 TaxID=2962065 RepID=UPI0021F4B645|nr:hypothetical protein [Pollutimonas sp. M17]UYO95037.1 hypothetical protein OEG81_06940 [Pollutimonas sp. M17]
MKKIGYSDFIRICQIECVDTWCDWLSLRKDGVYIKKPDDGVELTPDERAVLTEHPTGNLNEPALSFPCDISTLMAFLESQEIGVDIDDAYLRAVGYQDNDAFSVGGAISVSVGDSDVLLNVEAILNRIADARYPPTLNTDVDLNTLELQKQAHMMHLSGDIRDAFRTGCLTARGRDGLKYSAPPLGETFDDVYVSRLEFEGFSENEWLVRIVDATPENQAAPKSKTSHKLRNRVRLLDAEVQTAKGRALNAGDANSVWAELTKMAEKQEGLLIGHSSDGLQYKGKTHQDTGTPDVFTLKALRDRMRRAKKR